MTVVDTSEPACPEIFDPEAVRALAMETPSGWAGVEADGLPTTTGGQGAEVVLARTLEELTAYAVAVEPMIIAVCGLIGTGFEEIELDSNKTVIGVGTRPTIRGGLEIDDAMNVVVRNLYIEGLNPMDATAAADGISVRRTHHVWLDHLDISDARDGNLDVSDQSNYVTISYNRFWYRDPMRAHRFSNLVGSGDDNIDDRGHLKVTMHHNWWADNVVERMPRTRYGDIHVLNNFYSSRRDNYCIRAGREARLLVEANYFYGVTDPFDLEGGLLLARDNAFEESPGSRSQTDEAFEAPYAYDPGSSCDVPAEVTANAGPR